MADPRVKNLKIKTGVVKRLTKEIGYYEKEVTKEEERFEKKKAGGGDEHELKKQKEVIEESRAMIPDSKRRLTAAKDEMKKLLENEADLAETDDYKEAQKILEEAENVLAAKA
ncbi:tubulin-specific chaperone A-like [Mercenaria mercenaria]|uniref:tubulin-specific chaperone A-like n=1 Tax=Mercenaria mercenaria TaxID=6596 RepID=UPI001E1E0BA6|nr:tubulin-specific chaperone A-like [Mercenaria mercenaria]